MTLKNLIARLSEHGLRHPETLEREVVVVQPAELGAHFAGVQGVGLHASETGHRVCVWLESWDTL